MDRTRVSIRQRDIEVLGSRLKHTKHVYRCREVTEEPASLPTVRCSGVLDVHLEESASIRRPAKRRISDVSTSSFDHEEEEDDDVACCYIEEAPSYSGPELADTVDLSEWWAKIVASQDGSVGKLAAEGTSVKLSSELLLGRRTINLSASDGAEPREQNTVDLSPVLKAPTVGYVPASEVEGFEGIAEAYFPGVVDTVDVSKHSCSSGERKGTRKPSNKVVLQPKPSVVPRGTAAAAVVSILLRLLGVQRGPWRRTNVAALGEQRLGHHRALSRPYLVGTRGVEESRVNPRAMTGEETPRDSSALLGTTVGGRTAATVNTTEATAKCRWPTSPPNPWVPLSVPSRSPTSSTV
ncbi:hypothetical protein FOZ63_033683, partial [Perkinsus olseni]